MPLSSTPPRAPAQPMRVRGARLAALLAVLTGAMFGVVLPAASASAESVATPRPGTVAVEFVWADINGSGGGTSAAIMSRSVRARFAFRKWAWTAEANWAPVAAHLQKRTGATGRWADTGQTASTSSTMFDVRIPPYSL